MTTVLDASALLAFLHNEPGADRVWGVLGNGDLFRELVRGGAEVIAAECRCGWDEVRAV